MHITSKQLSTVQSERKTLHCTILLLRYIRMVQGAFMKIITNLNFKDVAKIQKVDVESELLLSMRGGGV